MSADRKPEAAERVWKIREPIAALEEAKDAVLAFWEGQPELAPETAELWSGDIREAYNATVAAWSMLQGALGGNAELAAAAAGFLGQAAERLEQAASELVARAGPRAAELERTLRQAFASCRIALAAELSELSPPVEPRPPVSRLHVAGPGEIVLPCALCGAEALALKLEEFQGRAALVIHGIARTAAVDRDEWGRIACWLLADDLAAIHEHVKRYRALEDGLDAYCPQCDAVYCREHYRLRPEYDQGFYDCTWGTCPKGHTRIVDD